MVLILLLWLVLATPVWAYDDRDYCHDMAKAARLECTAGYLAELAWCAQTRAFDLSIDSDTAYADAAECRGEAIDQLTDCKKEARCVD